MPLVQSSNRHPRIVTISPWSIPFFSPQTRVVGSLLREVNIGISCAIPTPLAILKWNTTIDDGMPSWACPAFSPHSAGVACPVSLYGEKARNPPTRAERGQELPIRRRSHATGSGPNYRRLRRCTRRRNPQPVAQTRAIFKRP